MAVFRIERTKDYTVMSNHNPVSYTHLDVSKRQAPRQGKSPSLHSPSRA